MTSTIKAAQPHRARLRPTRASTGPASAVATGIMATEPNQSYAETRDSFSSGISWCMVVIHETPNPSMATPLTNITTQSPATGSGTASPADGRGEDAEGSGQQQP